MDEVAVLIAPGSEVDLTLAHNMGRVFAVAGGLMRYEGSLLRPPMIVALGHPSHYPAEYLSLAEGSFLFTLPEHAKAWRGAVEVEDVVETPFKERRPGTSPWRVKRDSPLLTPVCDLLAAIQIAHRCGARHIALSGYQLRSEHSDTQAEYDVIYDAIAEWAETAVHCEMINLDPDSRLNGVMSTVSLPQLVKILA